MKPKKPTGLADLRLTEGAFERAMKGVLRTSKDRSAAKAKRSAKPASK